MSEIATVNTTNANISIFNTDGISKMMQFAEVMAKGTVTVPNHLKGQVSDCLAITMQSAQWGMNPFAVAQKTHIINGVLGYEAQLVNALVSSSAAINGRFHYEYSESGWEKLTKSKEITKSRGGKEVTFRVRDWSDADEHGLYIRVGAVLRGDSEITWGERIYLSSVVTRNSPLWSTNPKQQLAYLAVKYWARLYCPEVILGIYTPDELEERAVKDITPKKERIQLSEITEQQPLQTSSANHDQAEVKTKEIVSESFDADEIRHQINAAKTLEQATGIRAKVEELKSVMSTAIYTELKNKSVQAYHRIDAHNNLEAMINSLPAGGSQEAKIAFNKVLQTFEASKRKLGTELYDAFSITLNDMKYEYQ
ncbi:recombinase RecT [Arsenophonus sp. aPb]|uniref:RecT family recombinase n=1 Tax=Arsenophonus sp. aPb TaxID=3041619 RepID=UPI0024683A11|nr:recombinase RecT [Arsenophonus sp. aPb]WGL97375.1 recombinase RecT [Arsenophonus sp. aPb]